MTPPPATTTDDDIPNFNTGAMRDRLTQAGTTPAVAAATVDVVVDSQAGLATKADLSNGLKQLEQRMRNFVLTQTIVQLTALMGAIYVLLKFGI